MGPCKEFEFYVKIDLFTYIDVFAPIVIRIG